MQNQTAGRKRRDVSTSDLDTSFDSDLTKLENIKKGMAHLDLHLLPLNETTEILELDEDTYSQVMQDVFPLLVLNVTLKVISGVYKAFKLFLKIIFNFLTKNRVR